MADSVDFKRKQTDLRKIVGIPEGNQGRLGAALQRAQWGGARSIGYMNADNLTSGNATGTSGSTTLGNAIKGTTLPGTVTNGTTNKPATETGGNEVDPRDPSKSIHYGGGGAGSGKYEAEDVIDNATTLKKVEQFENGIGQITSSADGGGTLNALSGIYDCDNPGIELEIRTDGMFEPPPGWDDPNVPPPLPFYEQQLTGKQWYRKMSASPAVSVGTCIQSDRPSFATLAEAIADDITTQGSCYDSTDSITQTSDNICGTVNFVSAAMVTYTTRTGGCAPSDPTTTTESYFIQATCTPNGTTCPSSDVTEDPDMKWPEDGKLQLALNNGVLAPSDREAEADRVEKFFNGQARSQIDFCFGDGRTGSLTPTSNMGYMIYETSGGVATGIVKIFGSDNKVVGYTDVAGMSSFLPE